MGDTCNSAAEAETDRAQLRALLTALNAWDRALRRDGAWCAFERSARSEATLGPETGGDFLRGTKLRCVLRVERLPLRHPSGSSEFLFALCGASPDVFQIISPICSYR
jgi:hypothetical protein